MTNVLKQVFTTPDGKTFDTKQEALDYLRRPQITAAMNKVTGDNADLTNWLVENQEAVEMAFETGTIKRVTKSESKKLKDSLEYIKETLAGDKKAAFVVENISAIVDSFRWPSVKRMDEAEKATAARNSLVAVSNNEELATWVLANKDAVLAAYEAGKEKREVSQKATDALAAYRAKKAAEKAAAAPAAQ